MLLERRQAPRYMVDQPVSVMLDNILEASLINASETGVTLATPYRPILNSVLPITLQLPDNQTPCHARAQVVWSGLSGQIGLKLLKPEHFRDHFETWRAFTAQQAGAPYGTPEPETDQQTADEKLDAVEESNGSADVDELRAILAEAEAGENAFLHKHLGMIAALVAFALFGIGVWIWHARADHRSAEVKASAAPPTETVPVAPAVASPALPAQETARAPEVKIPAPQAPPRVSARPSIASARPQHGAQRHAQIVMKLNRFARVHPKLLRNPDRIYFDLGPGTHGEISQASLLRANDRLVSRIRIGRAQAGYTRVVLDLRQRCQYQAKVSSTPPYRLIINLHPAAPRHKS